MANSPPITLDPGREPWDRQPRESSRQYERFLRFRDLGRMRSLTALNKLLTELGDKLTYNTVKYQSHAYRWAERADCWDRDQDSRDRERLMEARREMVARHQKIAGALLMKAAAALTKISPTDLDPADIVRWIKLATDLEIRALGDPNQTISVTGPAGGPVQTEDVSDMTAEERQIRQREIVTELARRAGLSAVVNDAEED